MVIIYKVISFQYRPILRLAQIQAFLYQKLPCDNKYNQHPSFIRNTFVLFGKESSKFVVNLPQ